MSRGRAIGTAVGAVVVVGLLVVFALYNRGNPIVLEFGIARWRGEAVYALYGAVFAGLLLMFLVSLPADLAEHRERRRLERRVRDLARDADEAARSIRDGSDDRSEGRGDEASVDASAGA